MSSAPTMHALIVQPGAVAALEQVPVPELGDNQVLVKTKAVALNPSDWKHIEFISKPGVMIGYDFAGVVVKLGNNLSTKHSLKVGDRVSGTVHGGSYTDRGAFADFVRGDADRLWKIPENISFEEASTLNVGTMTAVQALFRSDRLGLVEPPQKVTEETWIFIYGGSTSVGQNAIQLAHLSGYKIATTASSRNHDLVKSLGADAVFDYRDPDVVSKVKAVSNDSIRAALDSFSDEASQITSVNIIAPAGGKVITVLPVVETTAQLRPEVTVEPTYLYTIFNTTWWFRGVEQPACYDDFLHNSEFVRNKIPTFVKEGTLKPSKMKVWENGLDGLNEGIEYMKSGKVNAEKLVFKLSD